MTDPLRISIDVACSAGHAFRVWTSKISTWWPPDHTVTGQPGLVVLQGGVGGRIYERSTDGVEHEWGQVTVWQPPARLAYRWYLGTDPAHATFLLPSYTQDGLHANDTGHQAAVAPFLAAISPYLGK